MSDSDEGPKLGRRQLIGVAVGLAVTDAGCGNAEPRQDRAPVAPRSAQPSPPAGSATLRQLGSTGVQVGAVSLGGEGVLRTHDRDDDAVAVIAEALRLGVRYCDTAPAYRGSQGYYGATFERVGNGARDGVFLASKTHVRDRDGSLSLLDESLATLGTDHLDLWQLHNLRSMADLDRVFADGGAIEAVDRAKGDGRVRHVGITGHADPDVLLAAMQRYDFDSVLCPINPADPRRRPFASTVVPEARRRGMAVIGMKVFAKGRLLADDAARPEELIRYAASVVDTVIVGCSSPAEVRQNLAIGANLEPMSDAERTRLEARIAPHAERYDTFKRG